MKKLLFLLLLIPFLGNSQATFTAPVGYNTGAPTATPSGVGTRWRFDLLTGKKYTWLPGSLSWDEDARGIDQVAGCSAPLYTPGYNQSTFAVNACAVPELYQWTGAAWVLLNAGEVYTAGTGISIDGSNVISNTAPNIVQTLSIAGQDLTLSGGGGTVAIPGGASDALGTGFTSGGGSGTIPGETVANLQEDGQFIIRNIEENDIFSASNNGFQARSGSATANMLFDNDGMTVSAGGNIFALSTLGTTIYEDGASGIGIKYAAYYPDIESSPQSFTDVQTVNSIKQKLATYTESERDAISGPVTGYVIFCTDATATDSSTGVMQVWNGATWKNAW